MNENTETENSTLASSPSADKAEPVAWTRLAVESLKDAEKLIDHLGGNPKNQRAALAKLREQLKGTE